MTFWITSADNLGCGFKPLGFIFMGELGTGDSGNN